MDFAIDPALGNIEKRIRDFVQEELIPLEADPTNYDDHGNINMVRLAEMRAKVKAAGLWAPQIPQEQGGLGFGPVGMAVLYEVMNDSILGRLLQLCSA